MDSLKELKQAKNTAAILAALLPGSGAATKAMREEAAVLSTDMLARGALLIGAPGSGKSTLARAIGLARWAHMLKDKALQDFLWGMQFDGPCRIAPLLMEWYREVSVTGLVGDLADSQLFGILKGAATDVKESKDGPFRLAMHGVASQENQDPTPAAIATGGVVFLDEIGDVPARLQPKLLSVLTGARVYPVGGEGHAKHSYTYDGLTIGATWLDLDVLRQDLVARMSDHVIRIPSLNERVEDLPVLVETIIVEMRRTLEQRHKRIRSAQGDKVENERFPEKAPEFSVSDDDMKLLAAVDWSEHGDLRGLTQVLRTAYAAKVTIKDAVARHRVSAPRAEARTMAEQLVDRILKAPQGHSIVNTVGEIESDVRVELVTLFRKRPDVLERVADHLEETPANVRRAFSDLRRSRKQT